MQTKQIAKIYNLGLPLEHILVTQPFGVNYVDFYQNLGLLGHNGTDFRIRRDWKVLAAGEGRVMDADTTQPERGWGNYIRVESEPFYVGKEKIIVEMIYAHLNSLKVKVGDYVNRGDFIAYPDNTGVRSGQYQTTTGDHLHFGSRIRYWRNGDFLADDNGYGGWIDPDEMFEDRGWNLLPVQKRYERPDCWRKTNPGWRPWHAYLSEVRMVGVLRGKLGRLPTSAEMSACVYGGWDFEAIRNPSMFPIWRELTKSVFTRAVAENKKDILFLN